RWTAGCGTTAGVRSGTSGDGEDFPRGRKRPSQSGRTVSYISTDAMAPADSKRPRRRAAKESTFLECDGITLRRAISLPPQLKTLDRGFVRMLRPHGRSRSGSAADRKLPRTDNAVLPTADR